MTILCTHTYIFVCMYLYIVYINHDGSKIKHFDWLPLVQFGGLAYSTKLVATATEPLHQESATRVAACFCPHHNWIHQKLGVCLFMRPCAIVVSIVKLYKLVKNFQEHESWCFWKVWRRGVIKKEVLSKKVWVG